MKTVFAKSVPGRTGVIPQKPQKSAADMLPAGLLRKNRPALPEMSELDVVRHYSLLSKRNFSVDTNFYPLGSCTMKYNPKFSEAASGLPGFAHTHPLLAQVDGGEALAAGCLEAVWDCEQLLQEVNARLFRLCVHDAYLIPACCADGCARGAASLLIQQELDRFLSDRGDPEPDA